MTNRYSSRQSSLIKQEQDFIKNGILQDDIQNNPALVRRFRIPIGRSQNEFWSDGAPWKLAFPLICLYVVDTNVPDFYISIRPNNNSSNNDKFVMRKNDTIKFGRKVSELFITTQEWADAQPGVLPLAPGDGWVDVIAFTDANFETGRRFDVSDEPANGIHIRYNDVQGNTDPDATQGSPQAATTIVKLCEPNLERRCLNVYVDTDCLLFIFNPVTGLYININPADDKFMFLKAGYYKFELAANLYIKVQTNNTRIYVSEEF